MKSETLNTAQALLAHIGLKTEALKLFGADILVKQWTASERLKYLGLISQGKDESDTIELLRPQARVVALSMVDSDGNPLFPHKWDNDKLIFDDEEAVETLVQNRAQETSDAFVAVSQFNGVVYQTSIADEEEQAVKN